MSKPTISIPGEPTRCTAKTAKSGGQEDCQAWAISGHHVCVYHGGRAGQTRAAAARNLLEIAVLAVQVQADLLLNAQTPPAVRARVAADVVRAAGLEEPERQEITVVNKDLDARIARAFDARSHTDSHTGE